MVISQLSPYLALSTASGHRYLPLQDVHYWTVGRSDDNNLVLPDRWISRNHAMFQAIDSGQFYLIDLGSRNGSFVNGRRVTVPVILKDGDLIVFGQTELHFFSPKLVDPATSKLRPNREKLSLPTAMLHVRRLISVMVVDIRDFTVMARQIDEKVLAEAIGTWFRRAGEIIGQHGSGIDKYIGDAVMAVWVHSSEDSTATAVEIHRILEAVSALAQMSNTLHHQFPLPFPLRIGAGLNTGYAMVGNTGSGDHPDYTPIGDAVNAAFRLESSTKTSGLDVAIGESTYARMQALGVSESIFQPHSVLLKGYETPMMVHGSTFATLNQWLTNLGSENS